MFTSDGFFSFNIVGSNSDDFGQLEVSRRVPSDFEFRELETRRKYRLQSRVMDMDQQLGSLLRQSEDRPTRELLDRIDELEQDIVKLRKIRDEAGDWRKDDVA